VAPIVLDEHLDQALERHHADRLEVSLSQPALGGRALQDFQGAGPRGGETVQLRAEVAQAVLSLDGQSVAVDVWQPRMVLLQNPSHALQVTLALDVVHVGDVLQDGELGRRWFPGDLPGREA